MGAVGIRRGDVFDIRGIGEDHLSPGYCLGCLGSRQVLWLDIGQTADFNTD